MQEFKPTWLYIKKHNITGLQYFGKTNRYHPEKYIGSGKYWLAHLRVHGKDISTTWCELFFDQQTLVEYALKFSKENNIAESSEWANLKFENGLDGGHSGVARSDETKEKLSKKNRGKRHTKETKNKISDSNKGKHNMVRPADVGAKISKALTGKKRGPMPDETKRKIGDANKGKPSSKKGIPMPDETKRKIGDANKGKPSSKKGIPRSAIDKDKIRKGQENVPEITCPHCHISNKPGCMKRWHFDNCKKK